MLSTFSALIAAYAAIAIEQSGRAIGGLAGGVALRRLAAAPPWYVVHAMQDGVPGAPGGWVALTLTGTALLVAAALVIAALVGVFRTAGWLRSLSLSLVIVALTWLPTVLVAAVVPGGGGPVAELYGQLGDPRAGRWAALALGLVLLWLLAGVVSRRAVATGRAWMRADAVEFRRRLVRVVAGYPLLVTIAALAVVEGWMAAPFAVGWAICVLITLVVRTV